MLANKKTAILIQARLSSSRLPNKMLEKIKGNTILLEYVYKRCKESKIVDDVVIITSDEKSDDKLVDCCLKSDIKVFRGSLNDVLFRYISAAVKFDIDLICRVCGDSPFVDIKFIDMMLSRFQSDSGVDYMTLSGGLNGFKSEIFPTTLLQKIYKYDLSINDKEHVTKYILDNEDMFNVEKIYTNIGYNLANKPTLTIDYPGDIVLAREVAKNLSGYSYNSDDVLDVLSNIQNYSSN